MSILLPNHSATLWKSLREISQLRRRVWHTSATSQHRSTHFAAAKRIAKRKSLISYQKSHSAGYFAIVKVVLAHECHFAAQELSFRSCETHCEVAAKMAFCCENGILLRKWHFAAKLTVSKSERANLVGGSSSSLSLTVQASGYLLRLATSAKVRYPEMARTRGAKSSSPSNRKKSLRKEPVPDSTPEPSPSRPIPPPVKPAPPKPPARRYLTRSGGRPLQKRPRVESSEPIDLTEQSPGPSPIPSPVPTLVPSPVPSPSPLPVPSPVPSPTPQAKSQEPQAPLPEPQIQAEIALEEVIRRPMLPQPPIEGNLDCRARPFHFELCFDLPAFRVRPELAQSFQLLRRYHMEHLLAPRDFFYPWVATNFYQSMTTNQVRDPTLIHFTIDGRHGILGARHIAEALQIPFEPTQFDNFRAWANPTELEMVRTLFRGAANRSHLLRGSFLQLCF
ncbi:hypothetical protein CK203_109147 [Vitis vinifera]|uniref:Uncharacterized protein n=1 Tax=Vitis vinifera TaxID=29760 RepID=A0A438C6U6_VITVI|nr:hypothetical protein CK203_109147 [Vitis vinifera]